MSPQAETDHPVEFVLHPEKMLAISWLKNVQLIMKRETLKVIRAQARKQTLPPNKIKPSAKTYNRKAKHKARLEQNQPGPFSLPAAGGFANSWKHTSGDRGCTGDPIIIRVKRRRFTFR